MKFTRLDIPDIIIFEPNQYQDARGYFMESYNKKIFDDILGFSVEFVQDNHSLSLKDTLRGLHYQAKPMAQGKLVRVIRGEVLDVAVDMRKESKFYGQWIKETLSHKNNKQMWIPPGFAHGFLTISTEAEFLYKTTNFYSPQHERCIKWNDEDLSIDWGAAGLMPDLSTKDLEGVSFKNADE